MIQLLNGRGGYNFHNVTKWVDKDMYCKEIMILPINLGNEHWATVVINFEMKTIKYLDSLGSNGDRYLCALMRFLFDSWKKLNNQTPFPQVEQWNLLGHTHDVPQQQNSYDCGVFCCMFAEYNAINSPLLFSQTNIPMYRQHIKNMIEATMHLTI